MENLVTVLLPGGSGESAELDANQNGTVLQAIVSNGIMEGSSGYDVLWNKTVVSNEPLIKMGGKTLVITPQAGDGGASP